MQIPFAKPFKEHRITKIPQYRGSRNGKEAYEEGYKEITGIGALIRMQRKSSMIVMSGDGCIVISAIK